jgi:hypothetical protein
MRDLERQPWQPPAVGIDPSAGIGLAGAGFFDLSPGERRDVVLSNGARAMLYLGRARRFLNNPPCGWSGSPPTPDWIEVVESWSP